MRGGSFPVRAFGWLLPLAALLYIAGFILFPYGFVGTFSFWEKDLYSIVPGFDLSNYRRILKNPLYLTVIGNSARVAATVTLVSAVAGYVLAYFIATTAPRWRSLLLMLVILPLWTSFLLRAYVWKIILGRDGLLAGFMNSVGLPSEALEPLLYSDFSISIALIYIFIPFISLPVYAALDKVPTSLTEAATDLGAPPYAVFLHVVLPLTVPALLAGSTAVFCLSFGDFIAPALLGGPDNLMIANVIIGQFGAAFDWPFGSALAMVVLAVVLASVTLANWITRRVTGGAA